jgi:hypothetical protein
LDHYLCLVFIFNDLSVTVLSELLQIDIVLLKSSSELVVFKPDVLEVLSVYCFCFFCSPLELLVLIGEVLIVCDNLSQLVSFSSQRSVKSFHLHYQILIFRLDVCIFFLELHDYLFIGVVFFGNFTLKGVAQA